MVPSEARLQRMQRPVRQGRQTAVALVPQPAAGGTGQDARHARQGRGAPDRAQQSAGTHLRASAGSAAKTSRLCCARGGSSACEGVRARQSRAPRAGPTARGRRRSAPATRRLAARCGRPAAGWAALCCAASAAAAATPLYPVRMEKSRAGSVRRDSYKILSKNTFCGMVVQVFRADFFSFVNIHVINQELLQQVDTRIWSESPIPSSAPTSTATFHNNVLVKSILFFILEKRTYSKTCRSSSTFQCVKSSGSRSVIFLKNTPDNFLPQARISMQ